MSCFIGSGETTVNYRWLESTADQGLSDKNTQSKAW